KGFNMVFFKKGDTSYNHGPNCEVTVTCGAKAGPGSGKEEMTTTKTNVSKPVEGARRRKVTLKAGMRWASTGNLKAVGS
ncbi:MAG: hypothetical protein Q9214_006311, partial [Letrouitia sp. 1 TL-2023]